jgi:hypothetical protein
MEYRQERALNDKWVLLMLYNKNKILNNININTVKAMIFMYCVATHKTKNKSKQGICKSCLELEKYSLNKLEKCPYGINKPNCSKCPVHCYSEEMRAKIQVIMRYSGPRMIYKHPLLSVFYIMNNFKNS